jgi:hypothetical protein
MADTKAASWADQMVASMDWRSAASMVLSKADLMVETWVKYWVMSWGQKLVRTTAVYLVVMRVLR